MNTTHTEQSQRVIVGVDGSPQSQQALRWAARFAATSGARLVAVGAWDYPTAYGLAAWPQDWDQAGDTQKVLDSTVDEVFGAQRPAQIQLTVRQGSAAAVLLDESEGALMLVVGSRGHGGFAGMLLGSVSAKVAEHANCPVLVVHGEQPPPSACV
jgi:nucleotide-binding universal stress UspA family protein